jgi:hypothetical protein
MLRFESSACNVTATSPVLDGTMMTSVEKKKGVMASENVTSHADNYVEKLLRKIERGGEREKERERKTHERAHTAIVMCQLSFLYIRTDCWLLGNLIIKWLMSTYLV